MALTTTEFRDALEILHPQSTFTVYSYKNWNVCIGRHSTPDGEIEFSEFFEN
jgi:folate-binding Fe-S cluster repair protein YgfZ